MNFNPTVFLQDISFLNDLMAEVSGIFPNMIGAVETTAAKTATEINTKSEIKEVKNKEPEKTTLDDNTYCLFCNFKSDTL